MSIETINQVGILAGIDFGKNIGLAITDSEQLFAIPCGIFQTIEALALKIKEKKAQKLIVGWPLLLSGSIGEQCRKTERMLEKLLNIINLPYHFQDERFSSKAYFGNNKDDLSAAWILEAFLNSKK
jgi:RNase H-fold protein (predicted Holliday junction resolvase)